MKTSERERKETPMNTWKTADAPLEDLEAELTDAGFDVRRVICRRTTSVELRVRDVVGGWAR